MTDSLTTQSNNPCAYLEEEMTWQKSLKTVDCGAEIIKSMNYLEAKSFLETTINDSLKVRSNNNRRYRKMCRSVYKRKELSNDEAEILIDLIWCGSGMTDDLNNWQRLEELTRYWQMNESRKPDTSASYHHNRQQRLERAKQYPIEQLYQGTLRNSGTRLMGLCPFHDEHSPSFIIFPETNTYHCFGCAAHGDSISFYMQIHDCDFNQALSILGDY